jgi:hypothetical protein
MVQEFVEQSQFVLVFVAFGVIEQDAAGQAEEAHQFEERKAAAGFLGAGLGISALVFGGVGPRDGRAVDDFGREAKPALLGGGQEFFGLGRHRVAQALEGIQRQAGPSLTVGAGAFIDGTHFMKTKEGLDLTHDFTAGAVRREHLVEKSPEGAAQGENPITAVGSLIGLGQKPGGNEVAEEHFELQEALGAEVMDAAAQGG